MKRKRGMNRAQENYIIAQAAWQAVNEVQKEKFHDFLSARGLFEESIPDADVERLSAEYEVFAKAEIENSKLAWENMKLAEKAVVEFALAICPQNYKEEINLRGRLREAVENNYSTRQNMIALVMNMDTKSLPILQI